MDLVQLKRVRLTIFIAILLLLAVFVISVATGYISLSPAQLGRTMIGKGSSKEYLVLFDFRLPKIMITILAGMGLAVSGAILQSITRNPLADSGILGINAGAGLMVVLYITFFTVESTSFLYILPLFALIGGILTATVIYLMSYKKGEGIDSTRLVLVGVGMAMAISGVILTLTIRLDKNQYTFIAEWIAGKIWGNDWIFVLALLPWILLLVPIAFLKSHVLNTLYLHESVSIGLGVPVERERIKLLFIAVALASASVSVTGGIAFVGLMSPHIARSLVGPRHQLLLPLAAMLGAILLLVADTIGRAILDPSGIPAGVIVTVIGAPYFMYLMAKRNA
ncbi:iron ABC transporter permease [Thermoflavimicrobium daqui]|uniref:Iron ABC transporter permease n=2 Tax=Thermoflavimicrobium daqui TaxID=2137476 RepID=A0A364K263_9BACL|nr:iron ABC transporter permease [Thermoflavimicrobium daqui]RAL22107.1 iron ABC transporter permease [Thermoflavimicrobium daqui]